MNEQKEQREKKHHKKSARRPIKPGPTEDSGEADKGQEKKASRPQTNWSPLTFEPQGDAKKTSNRTHPNDPRQEDASDKTAEGLRSPGQNDKTERMQSDFTSPPSGKPEPPQTMKKPDHWPMKIPQQASGTNNGPTGPIASATLTDPDEQELSRRDTKMFMRAVRHQHEMRRRQELEEARRLEQEAKALQNRNKRSRKAETAANRHQAWVQRATADFGLDPERPITEVPPTPPGHQEISMQSLRQGRAYVRTLFNTKTNTSLYEVIEPRLSKSEQDIYAFLRDTLVRTMDGRHGREEETWKQLLEDAVRQAIIDYSVIVDEVSTQRLLYHLTRELLGYGPIDTLMIDPMLEDISCDGPEIPIYVYHRQLGSMRTNVTFEDEDELDGFVIRLAQRSGKHISIADPLLDATLPDGSRLQTTLSREVTTRGSSFTIRKFRAEPLTPSDLIETGSMDSTLAAYYWLLVEHGASMIMAGGTASGKTTTLNAVCQFLPEERKIVSIEDTREINLNHENWIAATTRSGFGDQLASGKPSGSVDMYELLEAALRQRPEYLIVGEVRGPEALTLFQAMATGHAVYSTMHADSVASAVYRLENPPINVPRLMLQTLDAMTIQGQVRVDGKLVRRVLEVTELVGIDPSTGEMLTNMVFQWNRATGKFDYKGTSAHLESIRLRQNMSHEELEQEWETRVQILEWLRRHEVRDYRQVSHVVNEYYQRPKQVTERMKRDAPPITDSEENQEG